MAFISMVNIGKNSGYRGRHAITMRLGKSGLGAGYITKAAGLCGKQMDLQLDEENKVLRVKACENGIRVHAGGSFSFSRLVLKKITGDKERISISLTLEDDGWWYGSCEEAQHG